MEIKDISDYLKCIVANKVTLGSIIIGSASVIDLVLNNFNTNIPADVTYLVGSFYVGRLTRFGRSTLRTYQRVRDHIQQVGTLDEEFSNQIPLWYCNQTGMRLATREAGLEHHLTRFTKYIG